MTTSTIITFANRAEAAEWAHSHSPDSDLQLAHWQLPEACFKLLDGAPQDITQIAHAVQVTTSYAQLDRELARRIAPGCSIDHLAAWRPCLRLVVMHGYTASIIKAVALVRTTANAADTKAFFAPLVDHQALAANHHTWQLANYLSAELAHARPSLAASYQQAVRDTESIPLQSIDQRRYFEQRIIRNGRDRSNRGHQMIVARCCELLARDRGPQPWRRLRAADLRVLRALPEGDPGRRYLSCTYPGLFHQTWQQRVSGVLKRIPRSPMVMIAAALITMAWLANTSKSSPPPRFIPPADQINMANAEGIAEHLMQVDRLIAEAGTDQTVVREAIAEHVASWDASVCYVGLGHYAHRPELDSELVQETLRLIRLRLRVLRQASRPEQSLP